jgi:hypothetical protein
MLEDLPMEERQREEEVHEHESTVRRSRPVKR